MRMKSRLNFERGQALVIIALAAVVLFGFVALAIDGSNKFSDRRHAQNAADTSAIAGALGLVNDRSTWKTEALNRAGDNGYDGNLVTNQVWVFQCDEALVDRNGAPLDCGPYEGDSNYLSVVILSHIKTTFARVIGFDQMDNLVQAVTYWNKRGPAYDGNLIVALNPNPCSGQNGNVKFGGSSTVTLEGGGAFVNSGGTGCGMEQGGSCPVIVDGSLGSTGNGNINMDACGGLPAPDYSQDAYQFPPDMPDVPDECQMSGYPAPLNDAATNTSYLYPGKYTSFPPKLTGQNRLKDNVVLVSDPDGDGVPGVFCVNGDITWGSNSNSSDFTNLSGTNVTVYVTSGHNIQVTGSNINLSAPVISDYDYNGYLLILGSTFSGQVPNCHIDGNAGVVLTGTIFTPYCDMIINGNDSTASFDTQLIAYTVTINGNADTHLYYDADKNADNNPKLGLMR